MLDLHGISRQIAADWKGRVPDAMLKALLNCSGVTGAPARALAQ